MPAAPGSVASASPSCLLHSRSTRGGLEELDDVAGGVLEQDLPAAGSCEDVVAEPGPRGAEAGDFGIDVVDDEVDAVPAAGSWPGAVDRKSVVYGRRVEWGGSTVSE